MADRPARAPSPGSPAHSGSPVAPVPVLWWVGVAVIVLAACAALLAASTWGIGVSPDSVNYLRGAERLLDGRGIFSLNLHWPPGYPALLAVGPLLGADILSSTRVLHVLLFGLNALLLVRALAPQSAGARLAALLGLGFFASSTLTTHGMAWSEIPFVTLQLSATLLLVGYLRGGGAAYFWLSAGLGALAVLARFAGFPFAAVGGLFVLAFGGGRLSERFVRGSAWGLAVCLPAGAYMLGNRLVHGQVLDRAALAPGIPLEKLAPAVAGLQSWFAPGAIWVAGALAISCLFLLVGFARERRIHCGKTRADLLVSFGLVYILAYGLFVLTYMAFLDRYITLNGRLLFPAQVFFALSLLTALVQLAERPAWRAGVCILLGVLLLANLASTQADVRHFAQNGRGEVDRASRNLPIWDALRAMGPAAIYTNGPDFLYLHLRRDATMLPRHSRPESALPNDAYGEEMQRVLEQVRTGDAVVVLFKRFLWRQYLPGPTSLEEEFGLQLVYRSADGVIYAQWPRR